MNRRPTGIVARFSAWLLANPLATGGLTVIVVFAMAAAVPATTDPEPAAPWVPPTAVVLMAVAAAGALAVPRWMQGPPDQVFGMSWAASTAPTLLGFAAVRLGATQWLAGAGVVVTVVTLVVAWLQARRSTSGYFRGSR